MSRPKDRTAASLPRCVKFLTLVAMLVAPVLWVSAAPVPSPESGTGTLWGKVRLVPREGIRLPSGRTSAYDRRGLRDVRWVDYDQPGFAVIYLEGHAAPRDETRLVLEESRWRRRIHPGLAAVGLDGTIRLVNATASSHTVSCPQLGWVQALDPGEDIELAATQQGALELHVLDLSLTATVFVAPGPYAVVSKRGRWVLANVEPGTATLHAWHSHLPTGQQPVEIFADRVERLDLSIGVDLLEEKIGD